jgi:D-alanyl-D-alanine carboxypeptidase
MNKTSKRKFRRFLPAILLTGVLIAVLVVAYFLKVRADRQAAEAYTQQQTQYSSEIRAAFEKWNSLKTVGYKRQLGDSAGTETFILDRTTGNYAWALQYDTLINSMGSAEEPYFVQIGDKQYEVTADKKVKTVTSERKNFLAELRAKVEALLETSQINKESGESTKYTVGYTEILINSAGEIRNLRVEGDSYDFFEYNKTYKIEQPQEKPTTTPPAAPPSSTPTTPPPATGKWWSYPAEILAATKSGDDLTVLVNKKYKLPANYSPSGLVAASTSGIRTVGSISVRSVIISDLKELGTAAKAAGVNLSIISGYRSYSYQVSTYQYWVNYNKGSVDAADRVSARPGHSQHQLGTTIDFSSSEIGDKIGSAFHNTKAAKWLAENAWKYGFAIAYPAGKETVTGYSYESWHFRYIGKANAATWKASGLVLDQWLAQL